MRSTRENDNFGDYLWVGLIGYAAIADIYAIRSGRETLSHAWHRHSEHPTLKAVGALAIGLTAAHLLQVVDRKHDIFYGFRDNTK